MIKDYTYNHALNTILPPSLPVLNELKTVASDPKARLETIIEISRRDPVIALEIIKEGNRLEQSSDRPPVSSIRGAIQRVGNIRILELLDEVKERHNSPSGKATKWLEQYRSGCVLTSLIAGIVAEIKNTRFVDACQASALFTYIGDMVCAFYMGDDYAELADSMSRKRVNYRLNNDYDIDPEKLTVDYLRRHGFSDALIFPLDREAQARNAQSAVTRPICNAAQELYEAFEFGKADRYSPDGTLPQSSNLRLLQLTNEQIERILSEVSNLFDKEKNNQQ